MLQAALKALDLPLCFYDEANTNFFGAKSAFIHYQKACEQKQADLIEWLDALTRWRLGLAVADGEILLPAGLDLSAAPPVIEWVPAGTAWWNPTQEIAADVMAINNALRTRAEIRRERYGDDWNDVAVALAAEDELLRDLGLKAAPLPNPAGFNPSNTPKE
jgi:capsid protein